MKNVFIIVVAGVGLVVLLIVLSFSYLEYYQVVFACCVMMFDP